MNENMKIKYFDDELEVYDERRVVNKNTYSITLNYVPSPTRPFTVENGKTILTETQSSPNANQYVLDRENGLLLFNPAMKGKMMTMNYSAIGMWCISADKIFTNVDNKGKIVETLEDLMRENRQAIESIKAVGDASAVITQLQADIDSVTGLVGNIAEGSSVNEELTQNIESGEGVNATLINTISSANNKINEMNTWVNQHENIVNLDNRVDTVETEIPKINELLDKTVRFKKIEEEKIIVKEGNSIQLYTDEERVIESYPITSPDRVIYKNGISVEEKLRNVFIQSTMPALVEEGDIWKEVLEDGKVRERVYNGGGTGTEVDYDVLHYETSEDLIVGQVQNLGTTGFKKHPGGLIEQWGRVQANNAGITVIFPVQFSSECTPTVTANVFDDNAYNIPVSVYGGTPFSSKVYIRTSSEEKMWVSWRAIGY